MGPADPSNQTGQILMHPGDERGGGGVVIEIAKIITHPKYHPFTFENDIALIKFKEVRSGLKSFDENSK